LLNASFFKSSFIIKLRPREIAANDANNRRRYSGFTKQMNVPAIPSTAPKPYPNINSSPLVAAGAIGKVSSEAKFIETGMIGTKNIPRTMRFRPTRTLL
jgi:hypothetical protein